MFIRTFLTFALIACVCITTPLAHAQSSDVTTMLARMESIMDEMKKLQAEFQSLTSQLSAGAGSSAVLGASTSASPASPIFTESLEYGETNDDIKRIQELLFTDKEIYDHPYVTGFFGQKTEEAIKNLQSRFGLDPVGVIGPATKALLEGYFKAYPDGNYPDGVLSTKPPAVLGAATTDTSSLLSQLQSQLSSLTDTENGDNPADVIEVRFDEGEAWIDIEYNDGTRDMRIVADSEDEDEIVKFIISKTSLTKSQILELIEYTGEKEGSSRNSSGADEEDASDAIDDAKEAIHDARDEMSDASEDGDEIDWADEAYDEARELYSEARDAYKEEDWDEAVELAEEAEELADEAIDRIGESEKSTSDDIEDIYAYVGDDETYVFVIYEDDEDDFMVDTEDEDEVVAEIADELDIDEDEVEDLIQFYGKKVDSIDVEIDTDESYIDIEFEDGSDKSYTLDETDEDDIIEKLSDKLDIRESEVEDIIDFN